MKPQILLILGIASVIFVAGCVQESTVIKGTEWFQEGNTQDITILQTKRSGELEDTHIGIGLGTYYREDANQVRSPYYLDSYGDNTELVYSHGFKWMHISFDDWVGDVLDWQNVEAGPGEYSIDPARGITDEDKYIGKTYPATHPSVDEIISEYADNGINIVLSLNAGNEENHQDVSRFKNSEELERYSDYVRFMVNHFRDKIKYYEIWNEPSGEVDDYLNLVKSVVPVIREENPEAKIVIGALSGEWVSGYPGYGGSERYSISADFLKEFLGDDIVTIIDGISWHPFYGTRPDDSYYQNYPGMVEEIKEFATSNGFNGEFFADEISWKTYLEEGEPGTFFSESAAAKYYTRTIIMHRGLSVTVSVLDRASGLLEVIPNLCTVMEGNSPIDLPVEIQSEATNIKSYSFSLPDGDKLIALWTDGVAVEEDPGVEADLTIRGITSENVTATDIMNGYQQSITAGSENGNLVIQNLKVRDYPLILRIG